MVSWHEDSLFCYAGKCGDVPLQLRLQVVFKFIRRNKLREVWRLLPELPVRSSGRRKGTVLAGTVRHWLWRETPRLLPDVQQVQRWLLQRRVWAPEPREPERRNLHKMCFAAVVPSEAIPRWMRRVHGRQLRGLPHIRSLPAGLVPLRLWWRVLRPLPDVRVLPVWPVPLRLRRRQPRLLRQLQLRPSLRRPGVSRRLRRHKRGLLQQLLQPHLRRGPVPLRLRLVRPGLLPCLRFLPRRPVQPGLLRPQRGSLSDLPRLRLRPVPVRMQRRPARDLHRLPLLCRRPVHRRLRRSEPGQLRDLRSRLRRRPVPNGLRRIPARDLPGLRRDVPCRSVSRRLRRPLARSVRSVSHVPSRDLSPGLFGNEPGDMRALR